MRRTDSWFWMTAYSLLDFVITSEDEADRLMSDGFYLMTRATGPEHDVIPFLELLETVFERSRKVLEVTQLYDRDGESVPIGCWAELPLKAAVLTGETVESRWFWLMSSRFAARISTDPQERECCATTFSTVVQWLAHREQLPLAQRLAVIQIIVKNLPTFQPETSMRQKA